VSLVARTYEYSVDYGQPSVSISLSRLWRGARLSGRFVATHFWRAENCLQAHILQRHRLSYGSIGETMGGDDLGSDDEFLNPSISDTFETSLVEKLTAAEEDSDKNKRKRSHSNDDDSVDEIPTKKSSARVLIEAGRNLQNESAEVQCAFLSTALAHEIQLRGHTMDKLPKLTTFHFVTSPESTLEARLRSAISLKKMKKWKVIKSPMVLIVCVSARRAVAVLKELASLNIRAAKLFAKHMNVNQQRDLLSQQAYGLAVGTPHRLLALCNDDSLNLKNTQLVVLDSETNPKGFTVCTLPDTAGDCMELLRQGVLPQLKRRKDLKLAMF